MRRVRELMEQNKVKVKGKIERVIFENKDTMYRVFRVRLGVSNSIFGNSVLCNGYLLDVRLGKDIELYGEVVQHRKYGIQLKVEYYSYIGEVNAKDSLVGIELYLGSGVIKGLGERLAKKIIERFKDNTLTVLESTPMELTKIKGISEEKAKLISESFKENYGKYEDVIGLQKLGVSIDTAVKICNCYEHNVLELLKKNPYIIIEDIVGIGFQTADKLARGLGIAEDSENRVIAGIQYVLNKSVVTSGDMYILEEQLLKNVNRLLGLTLTSLEVVLNKLHKANKLYIENSDKGRLIFLSNYSYAESYTANKLLRLSRYVVDYVEGYNKWISDFELNKGFTLADKQKQAIKEAILNGVLVITGGPGTGKTTVINAIIEMFKGEGYDIELCAPTGRAAKRMSEATGLEAQTIHRLLGIQGGNVRSAVTKSWRLPADVVIVDECSMIDILLMSELLKVIKEGTKLILVGDVDQLASVGAGNVLNDIISSGCISVVRLDEIFRQERESAIVTNAHRINRGECPILNDVNKDFFFMRRYDETSILNTIVELVNTRLPKFLGSDNIRDIQVLSPMRKTSLGVENLNNILQNALNPFSKDKGEKQYGSVTFREGDKVMQVLNNYGKECVIIEGTTKTVTYGVFNGDEGIIQKIDNDMCTLTVIFDGNRSVVYQFSELNELNLAYAITVHKSQGSEYKAIIIPVYNSNKVLATRNLLYTGVTRAKELVVLVGIENTIKVMVNNNVMSRATCLKDRLINLSNLV